MDAGAPGAGGPLGNLELAPPVVVSEHDSLRTVALRLAAEHCSCALLAEAPLRVVTERDLALAWAEQRGPDGGEVGPLATERPYWVRTTASVVDAAALMLDAGVHHLLVVDEQAVPVGVVSMTDLLRALVASQDPATVYASFAAILLRPR